MDLIINGVKLEGDLMDVDFMDKFEAGMLKMRDTAQANRAEKFPSAAACYRAQCEAIRTCFDDIFGPGTAVKLFGEKMNVMDHMKAIETVSKWSVDSRKALNDFTNRYTQRQNNAAAQQRKQAQQQTAQFVSSKHGPGHKRRN